MHHPVQTRVGRVDARTVEPAGVRMTPCVRAIQTSTGSVYRVTVTNSSVATVLAGEWLGSSADEGRAKLR
jgi:hypothetical protein